LKGYLLNEQTYIAGEGVFMESSASENNFAVVFEDDSDSGYFYALEIDKKTNDQKILDAVHIYDVENIAEEARTSYAKIIWSKDWLKCALIINAYCHAVFDFENQGGYNRNEFPPPNDIWTKAPRKLTDEMIADFFK
jgi:hypothetical protein